MWISALSSTHLREVDALDAHLKAARRNFSQDRPGIVGLVNLVAAYADEPITHPDASCCKLTVRLQRFHEDARLLRLQLKAVLAARCHDDGAMLSPPVRGN